MKKIIAILLSLALLLGCAAGLAEEQEPQKQIFGTIRANGEFTLKGILPEGYLIRPFELSDDTILIELIPEDEAKPEMVLSVAYDEAYSHVERLNDLDDAALAVLENTFTDTDPYVNITYDETGLGTRLLVARTTSDTYDYLDIFTIYKGYFVEFVMLPSKAAGKLHLTEEETELCNVFLTELDFVEGFEGPELVLAGKKYNVYITGFDAEAKTIDVTILTPITLTAWETIAINEGDSIRLGNDDIMIGTLVYEGKDAIINDEYHLKRNEDGLYNVYNWDFPMMEEAKTMTLAISDGVTFIEEIDPATGEILTEAKELTAADLFTALAAAKEGGVQFDSQNVSITFDEYGEVSKVERYYAPWQ